MVASWELDTEDYELTEYVHTMWVNLQDVDTIVEPSRNFRVLLLLLVEQERIRMGG